MSASCPFATSPGPSVNGTVKTVGRVPPASCAVNVGPVHSYSWVVTSMPGLAASNWLTWASNAANASGSLPGLRLTTLIAVLPSGVVVASPPLLHAVTPASASAAATAATGVRMDLIVVPPSCSARCGLLRGVRGPQPGRGVGGQPAVDERAAGQQHLAGRDERVQRDRVGAEVDQ